MESILSSEERTVAAALASGQSVPEIAGVQDTSEASIERTRKRIREKTDRALATLLESPVASTAIADLDPADRAALEGLLER